MVHISQVYTKASIPCIFFVQSTLKQDGKALKQYALNKFNISLRGVEQF